MDGPPPEEEDFSAIPLIERCVHKNWKARQSAYLDLADKFSKSASDDDPLFRPYWSPDLLKKWVTDSNAAAQEKGIEAVCSLLRYSGENAARTRSDVMPGLVDKGLSVTRSGTKKASLELALLYVEVENTADGVMGDLMRGLDAKQPKLVAAVVATMKEIVQAYGVQVLSDLKSVIASVKRIFAHSDKTARAEGSLLAQALYQYVGPALTPSLSDLKPVQLKELQETFASIDASGTPGGAGRPTRFTRVKAREMEAQAAQPASTAEVAIESAPEPIDPLAFIDAAEVSKVFPGDFLESMASTKWKDKQEACLAVMATLETSPKVKDDSRLSEYAQALAKKMSDTNVVVVTVAANLIAALCRAVEDKGFGKYRQTLVAPILDRTKERKATVIEALAAALDAIFAVTSLGENLEDVVSALGNKNPQVKEQALRFLARCLSTTKTQPSKNELKTIAEAQVKHLGESVEPVRGAAAEGLGALMKIFGERALNPYMDGVNDLQKAKVMEAFEAASVACKAGASSAPVARAQAAAPTSAPTPAPRPVAAAAAAPRPVMGSATPKRVVEKPAVAAAPVAVAPTARFAAKKPPPPAAKPAAASSASTKAKAAAQPVDAPVVYNYGQEDAEARAQDIIPAEIRSGLSDAAWKTRLECAENLLQWTQSNEIESELLVRFLAKTPGWNEKIAQVSSKSYEILLKTAESNPTFGKASAALAIPALSEKLGDIKLKKPAGDALIAFAEKTSLGFVLAQMYEPLGKLKAPKAQQDSLAWIKQALLEFGVKGVALRELVQFLKTNLQNANGGVRTSATATLVALRLFVGPDVASFLEDLNPQLLTTITSEFAKVDGQAPPEPTRTSADLAQAQAHAGPQASAGTEDALDDLLPRVDLDKLVAQTTVIADSRSDSWKVRKEAFETLLGLLEVGSNSRLQGSMGEIGSVLKGRMADSNLSVKMCCLAIISKIAAGMGKAFQPHARTLTAPIASVLADNKATTRAAAVDTLSAVADACEGVDCMIPGLASAMDTNNPALRSSVLAFVANRLEAQPDKPVDLQPLVNVSLASLEDRNAEVRKAAQSLLSHLVGNVGYNAVMDKVSGMKAASKATITPLVQSARVNVNGSAPATGPSEKAASAKAAPRPLVKEMAAAPSPAKAAPAAAANRGLPRLQSMQTKNNALRGPAATSSHQAEAEEPFKPAFRSKLGVSRTLVKPAAAVAEAPVLDEKPALPLQTTENEPRLLRAKRDLSRWSIDTHSPAQLMEYLQKQMEGHASLQLQMMLFSKDRAAEKDHMAGLLQLDEMYMPNTGGDFDAEPATIEAAKLANIDLAIKYASLRLYDGSTQMILKCLDLVGHIVDFMDKTRSTNGGFSEAEVNCLLPALIFRLGDNKYNNKLQTIFSVIDRTIPGSKIIQYYVDRGVASTNAKTRAAAMELLAQLIKRRGDVAASVSNGSRLYKKIAEQIATVDPATRSAALDCIAYLYKYTGESVLQAIGELKPKERDLLRNRIDKLVTTTKAADPVAHVRAATPTKSSSTSSPDRSPRQTNGASSSSSPRSRSSPGGIVAAGEGIVRSAIPRPAAGAAANVGVGRSQALRSLQNFAPQAGPSQRAGGGDEIDEMLETAYDADPDTAVDALKIAQRVLDKEPERLDGRVDELMGAVTTQYGRIFAVPDGLNDPLQFRLAKHLVQTLSNLCERATLVEAATERSMSALLEQLTLGLLRTDKNETEQIKEMAKFINLSILRLFTAGRRGVVFDSLFQLLLRRSQAATSETTAESLEARHAELVLKCIWKLSRSAVVDLKKGSLLAKDLFLLLERFLQAIPPREWRQRGARKIPPGDMPLRTIKVLIQHVISIYNYDEGFEILETAFPGRAEETYIYEYLHRLYNTENGATRTSTDGTRNGAPASAKLTSSPAEPAATAPVEEPLDVELRDLVTKASSANVTNSQAIPDLYSFLRRHPDKQARYESMLDEAVGPSSPYKLYIKRRLDALAMAENRASSAGPAAGTPQKEGATKEALSPMLDTDTRLEMLKNKFQFFAQARTNAQKEAE